MTKKYYKCEETHHKFKGVKHKRCRKCLKWKDESEFCKDRARKDGLRLYCNDCCKAYARKSYSKNKKAVRSYLRYEDRHRTVRGIKEKKCSHCLKWKHESEFHRDSQQKDGLSLRCKECLKKDARKRLERKKKGARRNLRYEERHRVVNKIREKRCSKCENWKTESEFTKSRARPDGLADWCKKCSYKDKKKV